MAGCWYIIENLLSNIIHREELEIKASDHLPLRASIMLFSALYDIGSSE
jgi:hypothetical protein